METWKFNGSDDVMDSRDIIERYDELAGLETRTDDELAEMTALEALRKQGEDCADWDYGETLIRDDYFEEYTRELVADCYPEVSKVIEASSWPMMCLKMDWDSAARVLKMDYTSIEFCGVTYWIRS